MATKTVTIRIPDKLAEYLAENFSNINQGVIECIQNNISMRLYSEKEIREIFDEQELNLIYDSLNGIITEGRMRCNVDVLIANIEDANSFYNLAEKYNVIFEEFAKKVRSLTASQVECIYYMSEKFWREV